MLDGRRAWTPELAPVVSALRAPAYGDEVSGEAAAVAAFRAAAAPVPGDRRGAGRGLIARLLALKVAIGAAVLAGGGLALAAATGTIPAPLGGPPDVPAVPASPAAPGRDAAPQQTTEMPATGVDLCRRYLALKPEEAARALGVPPLRTLADLAGGRNGVRVYCIPVQNGSATVSLPPSPMDPGTGGPKAGKDPHSAKPSKPPKPSKSPKPPKTPKPPKAPKQP
jgi:hypothetical protein